MLKCGLYKPDVQEARIVRRSQPGVGLWSPHFFVLNFFKRELTLNPHNKCHSFGLFISLFVCCVVDCIIDFTHHKGLVGELNQNSIKFVKQSTP